MKKEQPAANKLRVGAWLAQVVATVFVATVLYQCGRRAGAANAIAAAAAPPHLAGGVAGAGAGAFPSGQVDVFFDIAAYLNQTGRVSKWAPQRRPGFKGSTSPKQALYDKMWTGKTAYRRNQCWGCRFASDIVSKLQFDTVLDAGTGNGQMVRWMRMHGKAAFGIELSPAVLQRDAPDLLKAGLAEQGSLTDLPYLDKQFDLVVSNDVLEHILPEQADAVVKELVRVAKRHIIVTISLKSHGNEELHTLLRPRHWWEFKFQQYGARPNRAMVWALQQKEIRFSREQGELSTCRMEGSDKQGGKFEVCLIKMPWLVGIPGMEVRQIRTITTSNAEVEPWFFAFTVGGDGDGQPHTQ